MTQTFVYVLYGCTYLEQGGQKHACHFELQCKKKTQPSEGVCVDEYIFPFQKFSDLA